MADFQIGARNGISSRTRTNNRKVADIANTNSIEDMRTRLAAINGTLYTNAYMNTMTENDMLYAIRLADAAGTV